jgi:hypothetical protein
MSGGVGGYLIAALSTFIGFVATAVWSLIAFTIHQCRTGPDKEDDVFFQQQAVYRDQGSAVRAFWENLLGLAIQEKHQRMSRTTQTTILVLLVASATGICCFQCC